MFIKARTVKFNISEFFKFKLLEATLEHTSIWSFQFKIGTVFFNSGEFAAAESTAKYIFGVGLQPIAKTSYYEQPIKFSEVAQTCFSLSL
jgi:hypothetical protein